MVTMKLTEDQYKFVSGVLDDMYGDDRIFDSNTLRWLEFKNSLLQEDTELSQIEALLEMCNEYIESRKTNEIPFVTFAFIIMYDMWVNDSAVWPVIKREWKKKEKS
jgi:hypothetical protein